MKWIEDRIEKMEAFKRLINSQPLKPHPLSQEFRCVQQCGGNPECSYCKFHPAIRVRHTFKYCKGEAC